MTSMAVAPPPVGVAAWLLAARPRTLSLSVTPVLAGAAIAWAENGALRPLAVLAALIGAVFIQIATNLHNDVGDFERGGDGPDRLGPLRATAQGWLSARQVKRGAWGCFALAALAGLYLVMIGGWPILALGLASILAGWGYTGGPWPIAYTAFGEVFVLGFFGVGAVAGTAWLQSGQLSPAAVVGGVALGLFAAAVLLTNNHRDAVADTRNGRRTLAILAGTKGVMVLYGLFMLLPFALLPLVGLLLPHGRPWLALGALPLALRQVVLFSRSEGRAFNQMLGTTAKTQLIFGLLLCLGLVIG